MGDAGRAAACMVVADQPADVVPTSYLSGEIGMGDAGRAAARMVVADQSADVVAASHLSGGIGIGDAGRTVVGDVMTDESADPICAGNTAVQHAYIAQCGVLGITKKAYGALAGAVDGQVADGMAQAVKAPGEGMGDIAQRIEALAAVPTGGGAGVDIGAQGIPPRKLVRCTDVLQRGQAVDDGITMAVDCQQPSARLREIHLPADIQRAAGHWYGGAVANGATVVQVQRTAAVDRDGCIDVDVAMCIERQLVLAVADIGVDVDIAIFSACCNGLQGDAGIGQIVGQGICADAAVGSGGTAGADGEVGGVDQPCAGFAVLGGSGDLGGVGHLHVGTAGVDEAAITAMRCAGIQGAVHLHGAAVETTQQDDLAVLLTQRAGLDDPGVVDHRPEQGIAGMGGEQHLTAVGLDQLVVFHQGIDHGLIDLDVEQAVPGKVQGHGIAGGQRHAALVGDDHALVADTAAEQRDRAAGGCGERAVVDHRSVVAIALETVVAGGEVGVADTQGGSDQTADVHLGAGTEQHAVGVDQEDPAIGVQLAHDVGPVDAEDAVKCNRVRAGLVEGDVLAGADREALPVDRQRIAGLVDDQLVAAGRADLAAAGHDVAAGGQGLGHHAEAADGQQQAQRQRGQAHDCRQAARGTGRRVRRGAEFGDHLDLAQGVVEHETVDTIHGRWPQKVVLIRAQYWVLRLSAVR